MELLIQRVVIGLEQGAIFAMLALAIVIVFRSSGLLNFAQGELAMFTTFLAWWVLDKTDTSGTASGFLPWWVATILAMVAGFVLGAIIFRGLIDRFAGSHANALAIVVVTIGLFLGLNGLAPVLWGAEGKRVDRLFGDQGFSLAGVGISWQSVGVLLTLVALVGAFLLLFQRTKIGLAMRAVATSPESASLVGVRVTRTLMIGWGLAGAIGALAGTFTATANNLDQNMMQVYLIYAFAAATLGGFNSPLGAVVGGIIIGLVTSLVPEYIGFIGKDLAMAPAFVLILLVLLFRPQGLFGKAEVGRV